MFAESQVSGAISREMNERASLSCHSQLDDPARSFKTVTRGGVSFFEPLECFESRRKGKNAPIGICKYRQSSIKFSVDCSEP